MRAGLLRERVTIQAPVSAQNAFGEDEDTTWSTTKIVWAEIEPMTAQERFRGNMERTDQAYTVRIRRDPTFTVGTGYRLLWGSVVIDVESVIDVGGRREVIEIVGYSHG